MAKLVSTPRTIQPVVSGPEPEHKPSPVGTFVGVLLIAALVVCACIVLASAFHVT